MEHKDITDPNIHEVKGASTASVGQVLTSNGDGTTTFTDPIVYSSVDIGSYRVVNTGSAVPLTVAGTYYQLTNNGAGSGTTSVYGVDGITDIWDEANSYFILSELTLGDLILVSAVVDVTTTNANTAVDIDLEFGIGGTTYTVPLVTASNIKTASTVSFVGQKLAVIRDTNTRNFPARIKAKADVAGSTALMKELTLSVFKRG